MSLLLAEWLRSSHYHTVLSIRNPTNHVHCANMPEEVNVDETVTRGPMWTSTRVDSFNAPRDGRLQ